MRLHQAGRSRHREPGRRRPFRGTPPAKAGPAAARTTARAAAVQPTSASPASTAPPSPVVTPPKLAVKVPRLPPDAAPQILAVAVSETTVQPGDTVSGRVVTTSNVASVQARIGGYAMTLAKPAWDALRSRTKSRRCRGSFAERLRCASLQKIRAGMRSNARYR